MSYFLDGEGEVTWGDIIFGVIVIAVIVVVAFVIRDQTIDHCHDKGGTVVEHPIYSKSYWAPGCVVER